MDKMRDIINKTRGWTPYSNGEAFMLMKEDLTL